MENASETNIGADTGFGDKIKYALSASRKLSFWGLVSVIFFTVSGGAFGIEPLVDSVLPLERAREGFERMVAGRVTGKVVFTV